MSGSVNGETELGRSVEMISNEQLSGEALAEWRSSEQVENGTPSTSPPYWDEDDEEDGGPKPSELYGKYTWNIEKFSQIKRELRSNVFEVGKYKWYILIYPQGCDVCNYLSLFLCVANHDKLLPGWSHFAQFTIAVVNKDPRKSKYSDTLHRFWKKEHDWGWKKFMELSKVNDGFVDSDTLTIKAQVQVIREKADRPFRCLDRLYRRELGRVYFTNVEQICRRFVEERRGKLGKLIEDKVRWSSLRAFWLGVDQNARRHMSREKADVILRIVVKHFFIEKEVTSTLVMDSLYSGLKALEAQSKNKNEGAALLDSEETMVPIVRVEKDTFVLVDDILLLLERAAAEPLPPRDEKGSQNRKDGKSGEDLNKDFLERDERRLTELGRRTVEMFVLAHIFSNKIEVAYQEAVALRRQEELIREEEAAWLAENEQKAKREKDKKSKKKQAKQKRNNRKGKEKEKEEKAGKEINSSEEKKDCTIEKAESGLEKPDMPDDVSEVSDSVAKEVLQPNSEERDASPVNWDADTSEVHHSTEPGSKASTFSSAENGIAEKKSPSVVDDSSSTCSTDSMQSAVTNDPSKENFLLNYRNPKSLSRGKNHQGIGTYGGSSCTDEMVSHPSVCATDSGDPNDFSGRSKAAESKSGSSVSLQDGARCSESNTIRKEVVSLRGTFMNRATGYAERDHNRNSAGSTSQLRSSSKNLPSSVKQRREIMTTAVLDPPAIRKTSQNSSHHCDKSKVPAISSQVKGVSKPVIQLAENPKSVDKALAQAVPIISRPSSAPLVPASRPATPLVSAVQTAPLLARSASVAGQLSSDLSPASHSYFPQSYRNVIMGNTVASTSTSHPCSSTSGMYLAPAHPQSSPLVSTPILINQSSKRIDLSSVNSCFPIGMDAQETIQNELGWATSSQSDAKLSVHSGQSSHSDIQSLGMCNTVNSGLRENATESLACTFGRQTQAVLADEFPHLDIINDLLDEEHTGGEAVAEGMRFEYTSNVADLFNTQYSYSGEIETSGDMRYSFPSELGIPGDMGSSASSCRFEQTQRYHDAGFQRTYSSLKGPFDTRDFIPQAARLTYANGHIDGLTPNQWQMAGLDPSLYGMRSIETDDYLYYNPDYSNLACGINGYAVYPPSSRHRK